MEDVRFKKIMYLCFLFLMKFIRTILLILNILLAIGLLLTSVAGSFNPSRFLWPSLLAYGFLPLLAANVLMVLLWGLMKRWQALISIAAIAVRWSIVGLFVNTIPARVRAEEGMTAEENSLPCARAGA